MQKSITLAALIASALGITPALSQPAPPDREAAAEHMRQNFEEMAARLNLSDQQLPQVQAIMQDSAARRAAVMEEFGVGDGERPEIGLRQMRKLRGEMAPIREETAAQLAEVLTPEQMAEFEAIQEEQRAAMRERRQGGE